MASARSLPYPLGVSLVDGRRNVAVYSETADAVVRLRLRRRRRRDPHRAARAHRPRLPRLRRRRRRRHPLRPPGRRRLGPRGRPAAQRRTSCCSTRTPRAIEGGYDWGQRRVRPRHERAARRWTTPTPRPRRPRCVVTDRVVRLGRRPRAPRIPLDGDRRLRDPREGLHEAAPRRARGDPGHLRGPRAPGRHEAPHRPRRHRRRADARAPVRAGQPPLGEGPAQLLGLQLASGSSPRTASTACRGRRAAGRSPSSSRWSRRCTPPASRSSSTWSTTTPPRATTSARPCRFKGIDNAAYYRLVEERRGALLRHDRHRQQPQRRRTRPRSA